MSSMEQNKGVLHPYTGKLTDEMRQDPWDFELIEINGEFYRPDWEIRRNTDEPQITEVEQDSSGTITFHTYHYNGGGSLEEVIEAALQKDS